MSSPAAARWAKQYASAIEMLDLIGRDAMTAETIMEACLARIEEADPHIRAFVDCRPDEARAAARAADLTPPGKRGPLHGLPVAVKEVFDVAGMRCGWGSVIHRDRIPVRDAIAVQRLKAAGAIVVGTVVSTEYAIAAAGPTRNPHDHSRTPGGSSSGPAAVVASGMVPVALGSQTVGSIVRPAAYCGVFGLKPTRGAIPAHGGLVLSPHLDHPGLIARSPADLSLLCRVLFGAQGEDGTGENIAPPTALPHPQELRVFAIRDWPPEPVSPACAAAVERALAQLGKAGARIEELSLPESYGDVIEVLYTIMTRDMALMHADDRDRRGDDMSAQLRDLIDRGRTVSDAEYKDAVGTAEQWRGDLNELMGKRSVILSAATEGVAPLLENGTGSNRPQALWSLVGLPVMAIPCGWHDGLPVGVQVAAGTGCEALVLAAADTMNIQE